MKMSRKGGEEVTYLDSSAVERTTLRGGTHVWQGEGSGRRVPLRGLSMPRSCSAFIVNITRLRVVPRSEDAS